MSITSKIKGSLLVTGFILVSMLCSQAYAGTLFPTIPDPGLPKFVNDVKIRGTNNGRWTFTGKDGFIFKTASGDYDGFESNYKLTANFDGSNNLSGGSLTFKGKIPSLGIVDKVTLLTADLTGFDFTGNIMGFNTHITGGVICDVWGCTDNESIYIVSDTAFPALLKGFGGSFKAGGFAVTTIPVPAAVWLFGSGLGMLGMVAKRRKQKA